MLVLVFTMFPVLVLSVLFTLVPFMFPLSFLRLLQFLQFVFFLLLQSFPLAIIFQFFRVNLLRFMSFDWLCVRRRRVTACCNISHHVACVIRISWSRRLIITRSYTFIFRRHWRLSPTFPQRQQRIRIIFCNSTKNSVLEKFDVEITKYNININIIL